MSAEGLPEGWLAHQDQASGNVFYQNTATRDVTWDRPAAGAPATTPPAADLPTGWAAHLDPVSGRTFYHNAVTNETCWDLPALPAVAAAGEGGYGPRWSTAQAHDLGGLGAEYTWDKKVQCLDKAVWSSVQRAIDALNVGTLVVEVGYCVIFSRSKQKYYILWREDKEGEAKATCNIFAESDKPSWSAAWCSTVGGPGSEYLFNGKAQLLDQSIWNSVQHTIDALNAGQIAVEAGFCVLFSNSQQLYFLLWQEGMGDIALATLGLSETPQMAPIG